MGAPDESKADDATAVNEQARAAPDSCAPGGDDGSSAPSTPTSQLAETEVPIAFMKPFTTRVAPGNAETKRADAVQSQHRQDRSLQGTTSEPREARSNAATMPARPAELASIQDAPAGPTEPLPQDVPDPSSVARPDSSQSEARCAPGDAVPYHNLLTPKAREDLPVPTGLCGPYRPGVSPEEQAEWDQQRQKAADRGGLSERTARDPVFAHPPPRHLRGASQHTLEEHWADECSRLSQPTPTNTDNDKLAPKFSVSVDAADDDTDSDSGSATATSRPRAPSPPPVRSGSSTVGGTGPGATAADNSPSPHRCALSAADHATDAAEAMQKPRAPSGRHMLMPGQEGFHELGHATLAGRPVELGEWVRHAHEPEPPDDAVQNYFDTLIREADPEKRFIVDAFVNMTADARSALTFWALVETAHEAKCLGGVAENLPRPERPQGLDTHFVQSLRPVYYYWKTVLQDADRVAIRLICQRLGRGTWIGYDDEPNAPDTLRRYLEWKRERDEAAAASGAARGRNAPRTQASDWVPLAYVNPELSGAEDEEREQGTDDGPEEPTDYGDDADEGPGDEAGDGPGDEAGDGPGDEADGGPDDERPKKKIRRGGQKFHRRLANRQAREAAMAGEGASAAGSSNRENPSSAPPRRGTIPAHRPEGTIPAYRPEPKRTGASATPHTPRSSLVPKAKAAVVERPAQRHSAYWRLGRSEATEQPVGSDYTDRAEHVRPRTGGTIGAGESSGHLRGSDEHHRRQDKRESSDAWTGADKGKSSKSGKGESWQGYSSGSASWDTRGSWQQGSWQQGSWQQGSGSSSRNEGRGSRQQQPAEPTRYWPAPGSQWYREGGPKHW